MAKKHKPRSGSLAFYPRKRARSEKPRIAAIKRGTGEAKALSFYGYKAGMTHIISTNQHKKSPSYGQKVQVPVTLIECPPIRIVGLRAYSKETHGLTALGEEWTKELPKHINRAIASIGKKKKAEKSDDSTGNKKGKKAVDTKKKNKLENTEKIVEVRLIGCLQPWLTGIGKKKPEIVEIFVDGSVEKQLEFAREFLGKELLLKDVFSEKDFLDVRAVTKGKGFSGAVKRAGVKLQTRKGKEARVVGSIGPWHPATVMYTVARAGQHGYHSRTEFNKKILGIDSGPSINPKSGFKNYGLIKTDYMIVEGSVPGPVKRCIGLRHGIRPKPLERHIIEGVEFVASKQ